MLREVQCVGSLPLDVCMGTRTIPSSIYQLILVLVNFSGSAHDTVQGFFFLFTLSFLPLCLNYNFWQDKDEDDSDECHNCV